MRLIEARDLGFLEGELQLWLERDLVNAEQAAGIRALYGVRRRSLARILLWAGVALVGLGLVGFAAANWEVFARVMAVLRRWLLDLLRFLTRWGVSTALAAAALTGAALSLFPSGKNGEPSRAAPFALGVAGVFGLLALGCGADGMTVLGILAAVTIGNLIGLIPIFPAGVGGRDLTVIAILVAGGMMSADAKTAQLLSTALMIFANLAAGLFFLFDPGRKKHAHA